MPVLANDVTVLQLSEAELTLHVGAQASQRSPVQAVVDAERIAFGAAALPSLRRDPRQCCERYLRDLSTDALGLRGAPHLSAADLLYQHLRVLTGAHRPAAFVVAPSFDADTLALVLGIALRAELNPAVLFDAATLAASIACAPGEHVLYVDPGVGATNLTTLELDSEGAERGAQQRVDGPGWQTARELWLRWVRDASIERWRIDPLLEPTRASVVAAAWQAFIATGGSAESSMLEFTDAQRLECTTSQFHARVAAAARPLVDAILASSPEQGVLLLDAKVDALPGLADELARYRETRVLAADALAHAVALHAPDVELAAAGDGVPHLQRLPFRLAPDRWRTCARPPRNQLRLLLVTGEHAFSLPPQTLWSLHAGVLAQRAADADAEQSLRLQVGSDHLLLDGAVNARVNGHSAPGRTVMRPGDELQTDDGTRMRLVALHAAEAAP